MTDEDYLRAVLNCDDQSGMATDAAWRAVSALRARAERAEAEVQRLHRVIAESLPYIDFAEQLAQAEAAIARVRELCEQTTVSVSIGCRCYTDECSGTCGAGRPLSWHLNPAAVLAALGHDIEMEGKR